MPAVQSSAILAIEHEEDAGRLLVTFVGGRAYAYDGVPRPLYDAALAAPSKGRFFNEHIRDRFACREVTGRSSPARRSPA